MFRFSTVVLATTLNLAAASNPAIAGYEPITLVTDHAGIAGDQGVIEKLCGEGTSPGMTAAGEVYRDGGHSKSYARITLSQQLANEILKGTEMTGVNANGEAVAGKSMNGSPVGATFVEFQYATSTSVDEYVDCKVGGLPESEQVTTGCLAPTGTISAGGELAYDSLENLNGRTIQGFSTDANRRMKPGDNTTADWFDFYKPYLAYYGEANYDFGDKIVNAGFNGQSTSLANGNVIIDGYGFDARCQIAKKGTAYIITALYAVREMYDAIFDCQENCDTTECNDDAVHALDEAVAFYVGNEHANDGVGNLAYALAEKRCKNFATCSDILEGESNVNKEIMVQFNILKNQFSQGQCSATTEGTEEVIRLMQIPLIQGTLRYAYFTDTNASPTEVMQAEGLIFALGVLPKVHECDATAAQTIYDNMKFSSSQNTKADFAAVKAAFESVYECMGITCAEVGGLVDDTTGNTYLQGAAPCGGVDALAPLRSSGVTYGIGVLGGVAAVFAALMM